MELRPHAAPDRRQHKLVDQAADQFGRFRLDVFCIQGVGQPCYFVGVDAAMGLLGWRRPISSVSADILSSRAAIRSFIDSL
jgi:hypothetical protein